MAINNTLPTTGLLSINPKPLSFGISGSTSPTISRPLTSTTTPQPVVKPTFDAKGMPVPTNTPSPVNLNLAGTSFNQPQTSGQYATANNSGINNARSGATTYNANTGGNGGLVNTQPNSGTYSSSNLGGQNAPANYYNPNATPSNSSGLGDQPPVQGLFPSVVSSLANRGSQPSQAYTDAMNNYQGYNRQLQQSLSNEGTAIAQNGVDRIPVGEQSGLDAVIRNQYLQQQQSIAAGAQGASNALGAANTQQANQQSALNQAAGYAQPQLGSIGQVPFNPTDLSQGSPLGAPGGTAADAAKVAGQFQGAQAAAAAPGQAQASNIQTGGTAATNSYAGIYNTANTNAANYSQQQSAINAVGNQALSLLNSIPGRSSSQFVNARLNQLATQFSSPEYAAFNTAIQSLQARIGQALQAGEIPTAATGNAQSIANGDITVGGLASTLQQVDKEMGAFVQTQNDLANYAKSQLGNGGTTSTGGSSSNSTSGFGWNGN